MCWLCAIVWNFSRLDLTNDRSFNTVVKLQEGWWPFVQGFDRKPRPPDQGKDPFNEVKLLRASALKFRRMYNLQ